MPFGLNPTCKSCSSSESEMWHKIENGDVQCNKCVTGFGKTDQNDDQSVDKKINENDTKSSNNKTAIKMPSVTLRKSARNKAKTGKTFQNKPNTIKGRNRRIIFKRNVRQNNLFLHLIMIFFHSQVYRAPPPCATSMTLQSLFFKGQYYQVGDIVSMVDVDGGTYYAQITGFLQDQYCEKSATVTWLLPLQESPTDRFDPSTYFLGPEEDLPRKLECMQFVCHAPSDYYLNRSAPYPTLNEKPERGFIWTNLGGQIFSNSINDQYESQES